MIKVNLNEGCRVKLTKRGEKVLLEHYKTFLDLDTAVLTLKVTDIFGYKKFVLWELISIFGEEFHNGMEEILFEGNDICFN